MRLPSRLAALLAAACLGLLAPGSLHAQKALVVCPPSDGAGCARIAEQLALTGDAGAPVFPGGVDRLYEELRTLSPAQLRSYAVVFVPSLADEPYALLREEAVRTRLRQVLTGRVAAWSGTPDRGAVEGAGAGKLELIRGLGRWAAAGWSEGRTGLVVLQDFSNPGGGARRYDWVEGVAGVEVRPDPGVRSYDEVEKNPASPAAEAVVGSLAYRNLASFGFAVPDSGAAQVAAWGRGRNGRGQAVLLTFRGEEAGGPGHPSAMSGAGSPTDVAIHGGQSQTGEVGTQLAQPLRVLVTDALGNGVPGETVTWTVTSGGGSLSAPTSTTDASGIAAIAWTLGTTAGTQTVAATRAGLAGSPVTFTAAASPGAPSAATSTITASPTTIPADGTSTSAITAQLKDAYGNNCTTGITSGGLSTTRGTIASVAYAGNGMYTATLTSSTSAGTATVIGILAGDTLASTATVTFTPGAAAQLAFAVQPSSTPAGTSISPAVQVTVRDAFGNTVTGATNPVTLAIGTNPAGGTLSGTTTVAAVNGVATFSNLGIDRAGTGYTLAASSGSLTGATSSTFNVTKAANTITVTPDSATLEVGATRQFTASVNDVAGNPIPSARVIWDSSDGTVIRVSGTGLVTALGTGFASVTATYEKSGDVRGGAVINVVATPATPRQYLVSTDTPDPAPGATITIRAQLADSLGAAVKTAGRTVTWSKTLPAGSFATPTSTTDTAGVARVAYAVSTTAGTMDSVTATDNAGLKGTSGPIRVQIGAAAVIRIIRGDTQTAKVSTPVPVQPTVQVVDASGNGVPNVTVTFAPVPGSGSVTGGTQTTSASGEATVGSWTLKATPGPGSLTVSAAGLTVTFTATALPGEPTDIAFQDGDNQTGVVGTALGQPLRVLVTDSLGNGVPGETVTWEVDAGSGSVSDPSSVTDLNGIASTTWTLGTVVDTQTVRARHDGINGSPVTFTAVATPTGASRLTITTQPSDSVQGGVNFPRQPVIRIQDPFGNAVSQAGVSVTAAIASGGGTLGGTTSVSTDASGAATFTSLAIGGIDGDRTLSFSATGLTPATSNTVSVAAGTPAQLGITTQPSSAAQAGSVFPQQPVVQLLDASGNPTGQAGVTVTAAVASGAGTLGGTVTAVTNALGTATFTDLSIGGTVGDRTLSFSATGLTPSTSNTTSVTAGNAAALAFSVQPSNTAAGAAITPAVQVTIRDAFGNTVTTATDNVTLAIGTNPSGGTLSGTTTVAAVNGLATFPNLSIDLAGAGYTLAAFSGALTGAASSAFDVAGGAPAQLVITTQPSDSAQSGTPFDRQPVVQLRDASGNPVSQAGVSVTAAIASGGGTLGGTATVSTDASGAAAFTNLSISGIDGDRTLSFSATGLTGVTSNTVTITAGPPAQLGITTQPSSTAQAGGVFPQQPVVQLLDASGNPTGQAGVTVTAAVASGAGTLGGTTTAVTNGLGAATFTDLSIGGTVGDRTLSFSATGLTPATSNTITVAAGSATSLVFTVQPSDVAASASIAPAVQVSMVDAFGNVVTGAIDNVTLAIGTNPSGGTLSGTTTVAAVNGVATFPNLSIDLAGAGYTLAASSGGLTGAASSAFDVAGGAPAQLAITTQPSDSAQSGTPFDRQPVVQLRDAFGNVVSQAGVSVTAYIASGGGTLGGTATVSTDAGGAAAFTNLSISGIDGDRTLSFSATGLTPATSSTVSVAAGTPAQLGITTQPSSAAQAGIAFAQQPVVQLLDASGNPTGQAGVTVTAAIASGAGTLGGTVTAVTNGLGVATFTDLFIGGTAGSRTVSFSSGALTPSTSGTISVTAGPAAAVAFTVPPSSAVASAPISPAVQVSIVDAFGNVVTGATDNVTVAVGNNPSGGTLSGTTTVPTVGGTATFPDLSIDLVGTGYTLSAGSVGLSGATSTGFNVVGGTLDHFLVEAAGGGPIGSQVVGTPFNVRVTAQDAFDNTVTSFTGTVGFTSTPSGGISAGGTSGAFTAGVLTSHAITFGPAGSFTLTATRTGGTESGTSNSFDVEAPPVAVNEGPASNSAPGQPFHAFFSTSGSPQTFNLAAPGVLSNDNLGFPPAAITSFGADSLGGPVTGHPAGSTVSPLPGHSTGSLSVGANGSTSFTPPDGFTGSYVFRYRITNASGTSDAQVTIAVGARPSAVNDTYSPVLVGNVPINTATSTGFRVTANDAGDGKVLAIVGQSGGTATLNADSTFRFRPNPGFEGAASFTYTVTNGFGTSAPATVSMTVATPVWFVSDTATTGGDGRFDSKFNALSSFAAVNNGTGSNPAANDRVFLYTGAYTGPLTLLSGQQLVGQGATGSSLGSVLGVAWPADAGPEPAVNGTSPTITSAAGGITLGSGNTLRGFNLGNVTGTALAGTSFGTVVVANVGINTTGQALSLTTGTLNGGFTQLRSTGGTNNVFLSGVATTGTSTLGGAGDVLQGATGDAFRVNGGTGSFTYSGNVTQAGNAAAVNVSGGHSGTLTFQTGTVSATSGTGLQFNNADGTYAFSGTSTLNGGNAGIDVTNGSSGTFTFSSGSSITNPTGETVVVSNSAPTFTYSGTLSKTGSGSGITLSSNTGGTLTFDGPTKVFSTGSATAVSLLNNNGATIVFADSLRITTTTGAGFSATGGGTVRVAGTHNSITSAGGMALNVSNTTIGTGGLNFRSISASGGSNGIVLSNTGSTAGLTVTGSGTAGSGGTIQNTTGADGTTSGIGVYLNNTRSVSLAWMQMNGHAGWAVRGSTVNGFTMDRTRITGSNGTDAGTSEGSVRFTGLTGSASITGSRIEGGAENNLEVVNSSGSLNRLTLTGDTIGLNGSALGADGVSLEATGGTLNVTIQNSVFTGARSRLFRMAMQAAAGGDLVFTGNTLSNGHGNPLSDAGAMDVTVGGGASLTYSVSGNTMRDSRGTALLLGKKFGGTPGNGTMSGTVANNAIGVAGVANSGSTGGAAIEVLVLGRGSHTTLIQNNQLRGYNSQGVLITAGGADEATTGLTHDAAMNVTLQGNTIAEPGNNAAVFTSRNGVMLNAGTNPGDDYPICLNLTGNTVNGSGADPGFLGTGQDYRLRQRQSTTVRLPGYTGAATDAGATLVSDLTGYLAPRTSGSFTLTASAQSTGFLNTAGGAPCATP